MASFRRSLLLVSVVLLIAVQPLQAQAPSISPDDAFLNALKGKWTMNGAFMDKPVQYHATGERVLQGGFLRLHMIDAASSPKYEADVFIGFDPQSNDYILHWLDRFGAAGARVVGTGTRKDSVLTVIIPYKENAFRDTFEWQKKTGTWVLIIDSQNKDGSWSLFARYTMVRT